MTSGSGEVGSEGGVQIRVSSQVILDIEVGGSSSSLDWETNGEPVGHGLVNRQVEVLQVIVSIHVKGGIEDSGTEQEGHCLGNGWGLSGGSGCGDWCRGALCWGGSQWSTSRASDSSFHHTKVQVVVGGGSVVGAEEGGKIGISTEIKFDIEED